MALITCEHVCLGYDGQTVLRDVTKEEIIREIPALRKTVDTQDRKSVV